MTPTTTPRPAFGFLDKTGGVTAALFTHPALTCMQLLVILVELMMETRHTAQQGDIGLSSGSMHHFHPVLFPVGTSGS